MNIRSAALGLMCLLGLVPAPAAAFSEIEVRQDHDGAGPSHIFHLHDSVVAVVDPLDGTISAYADTHGRRCGPPAYRLDFVRGVWSACPAALQLFPRMAARASRWRAIKRPGRANLR